jgi:hypothetical protein
VGNIIRTGVVLLATWLTIVAAGTGFAVFLHPRAGRAPRWDELMHGLGRTAILVPIIVFVSALVVGYVSNTLHRRWRRTGVAAATTTMVCLSVLLALRWIAGNGYRASTAATEAIVLLVFASPAVAIGSVVIERWTRDKALPRPFLGTLVALFGIAFVVLVAALVATSRLPPV